MLTERQELILKTIIQDFTHKHEPVGSKTVMKQLPIKVSSATIRNEMAVLEDQGLIEKTHSSSGRVPSSEGYRYYLDNLVEPLQLPESVYNQIVYQLDRPFHQVNEIVQEAAKILSDLTNYTAFAEGPESHDVTVTGFRIVPLSNRQVMAILVTSDGNVKNQVYALPHNIHGDEIEKAVRMINDELVGKSLKDISPTLLKSLTSHQIGGEHSSELLDLVEDVLKDAASEQMYVDGQINLLNNTSEKDIKDIRSLYELVDQNDLISELMTTSPVTKDAKFPVKVTLGSELPNDLLKNYSLLTAEYSVGNHGKGTIALLGPTNMPYSQMIGLLEYFRNELARKLLDYYGKFQ
ncbi:heat-inducible transcriptional repressor HrcA [Lactobacillus kefiranofaciens]|uniref:Heat-inducible transcription repressor HrcA n=1 Tax=Lactobacillus kefiranofaciens TaxID=267818 RepID=A0AAX3UFY9_9LACO|nr:heat-inducible transcriptional repressor HrcA [Lactobacillus kefiranofaciens]AEG40141.1 Heat-inducible transcription repressor hrcA [Lactobacillus kefiranofaciens subsp. kefiranofaciens]KRL29229.1 heat-inducible transcription repressor hrcA [Lactobacillus kefiranofaciens subsp. kefirgranum DSM 10550 = JCM 8572]KRM23124.1 heat-inducible transcription repressor hrcA [Lactobacillus kefiranofaciens subsp. kefiranofaciens DSM 5016 = JCM 6985]MCJ2171457.1 heat-inducible transcriptional repressor H